MAGTALTTATTKPLPAHLQARLDASPKGNIVPRQGGVNALVFDNSGFSISMDGTKTKLMKTNADGEEEAVQILSVIVLDYNKDRGREYYSKPFDAKNPSIPDCWSEDSKAPHENVPNPVAKTCAVCPNAKKGSAHTADGKGTVACGQFQKLAVVPAAKLGAYPPLRLRLKITSIYDKSGVDKHPGWHAWTQYLEHLTSRGIPNTYWVPTRLKFDKDVSYAKLLFAPGKDYLDEDLLATVEEMATSEATQAVLASTYTPSEEKTGKKPLPEDEDEEELPAAAVPAQARPAKAAKPAPAPAPVDDEEEDEPAPVKPAKAAKPAPVEEDEEEDEPAPAPAPKTAKAAATATNTANVAKATQRAAVAKAAPVEEEDEEEAPAPAKPAKAAAAAPAKAAKPAAAKAAPVAAPAEVADLMQEWDD